MEKKISMDFLGETVVEYKEHITCFVLLYVFLLKELSLRLFGQRKQACNKKFQVTIEA